MIFTIFPLFSVNNEMKLIQINKIQVQIKVNKITAIQINKIEIQIKIE